MQYLLYQICNLTDPQHFFLGGLAVWTFFIQTNRQTPWQTNRQSQTKNIAKKSLKMYICSVDCNCKGDEEQKD